MGGSPFAVKDGSRRTTFAPVPEHARMQPSPPRLGMFDFNAEGRISPTLPASRMGMDFVWRGHAVTTSLVASDAGGGGTMVLSARAGRVPSSARAPDARPDAFKLLRHLPALLPEHWSINLCADHSLRIEARLPVEMPAHVKDLLVPAVRFCLEAAPILDLLAENMMGTQA